MPTAPKSLSTSAVHILLQYCACFCRQDSLEVNLHFLLYIFKEIFDEFLNVSFDFGKFLLWDIYRPCYYHQDTSRKI
ncbi:hypothetical protein EGR_02853 [Echinococcus granulosus]|uniref:Uncharacterized protein n=1 Tax=Echinococcus granulosus TaxID=6210 RepID=W6ULI8_ECHGR|nr:hypothetical protein EGR_02853 [Echinococcus granulosus]EUB62400.1 hypothetical protein EGR_02853 [Echinococcus granulosus]